MSNIEKLDKIQYVFEKLGYWSGHDMDDLDKAFETSFSKDFLQIEKALKALEVIKEKGVNWGNFIYWLKRTPRTYDDYLIDFYEEGWYLHYKDNSDNRCKFYKLTKEEYDLLKEVLA